MKPASTINTEFDSRIIRVSSGASGVTRPGYTQDGKLQKVFCLHCGKPGGGVTSEIPAALKGDPGVIYICLECDKKLGKLPGAIPVHATSFITRPKSKDYVR